MGAEHCERAFGVELENHGIGSSAMANFQIRLKQYEIECE